MTRPPSESYLFHQRQSLVSRGQRKAGRSAPRPFLSASRSRLFLFSVFRCTTRVLVWCDCVFIENEIMPMPPLSTLHRARPCWPAGFFSVLAGAWKFCGMERAGFRPTHHHHQPIPPLSTRKAPNREKRTCESIQRLRKTGMQWLRSAGSIYLGSLLDKTTWT